MRAWPVVVAGALVGCGRVSFEARDSGSGDGGIRPPGDSMVNGDAPDSAALFDCKMTHPSAIFCDGFEAPLGDTYDYSIIENGRAEATTTRAYRGSRALEVETFAIAEFKTARWGTFYPAEISSGDLYIRMFYWVSGASVFNEQASIVATGNSVDPYPSTYFRLGPDEQVLQVDASTYMFSGDFPRERWVCAELHIRIDAVTGFASLTLDGGPAMITPPTDSLPNTGYSALDVGLHYATPGQQPVQMWVDEVIVNTSPIGCN